MSATGEEQAVEPPPPAWPEPLVEDFSDPDWPELATSTNEEVERWVLENKRILLRTVTWNLCAKAPPSKEEITRTLLPANKFHLYVIGTEECERSIAQSAINPSKKNWESYLCDALGPRYVPLRSHTLQAIHMMVFVHEGLAHLCTMATSAAVAFGVGNTLGNKGAVALLLRIGSLKLVIVNAHFAAHQNAVRQRNNEFHKANRLLPGLLSKKESFHVKALSSSSPVDLASPFPTTPAGASVSTTPGEMPEFGAGVGASEPAELDREDRQEGETSPEATGGPPPPDHPSSSSAPTVSPLVAEEEGRVSEERETVPCKEKASLALVQETTSSPETTQETLPAGDGTTLEGNGKEERRDLPLTQNDSDEEDDEAAEDSLSPVAEGDSRARTDSTGVAGEGQGLQQVADVVIFMGDLNYRIQGTRPLVDKLLAARMYEVMIHNDQLRTSMRGGAVFPQYAEPPLNFLPTYKYDIGKETYDSSGKGRIPSWTDRILYIPSPKVVPLAYNSDASIRTSDHRPVYASFAVEVSNYIELTEKNEAVLPTRAMVKFTSESQVCSIS